MWFPFNARRTDGNARGSNDHARRGNGKARARNGISRPSLPRGATIAFISTLCFLVIGFDLFKTWDGRSHEIAGSRREVVNLAWSAAQHAEVAFRLADMSLVGLVERVELDGTSPAQLERMRNVMTLQVASSPILQGLTVIDASGDTIVNHLPVTAHINVADREFYQYHLTHADRQTLVSGLLHSRVTGNWVVALSRRANHPDGSFAGIISATVDVSYFQGFYDTFDLGHHGSAALLRDNGIMLVRHPVLEAPGALNLESTRLFRELLPKTASGSFDQRSSVDGLLKIYAYRRVAGYPLVVVTALSMDEELAAWRAGAIYHLYAATTVALLLSFFAIRLGRQIRLLARAERKASETNIRLDQLARHLGKARDQSEQANQAKSRFLTGMTHELRTPLHGILGYAELLSLEGDLNPKQSERVAVMITAGEHLLGMINSVLDVSQIEADRLELHPVEIELTGFARACLDVVRPAAEAKGLVMVVKAAAPFRLLADPTRMRQVLINLLGNAIKFTPAGSIEVRLGQTDDGACVRLEVADTGPGIPTVHREKLFQTFERLTAEVIRGIEGTGVGLALAASLVRLMGGRIGYADNPGGGSVFWLELPVNNADPVVAAAAAQPHAAARSLRVLVVDDDALNRGIASGFLRFGGHVVVCLDNGAAAVEVAGVEDFDVILMDVRMPGMNGLEATRQIRALPGPRGMVPVVAATAQAFAEQIEICRQAGMDSHVSKPFRQAALLAAVEQIAAIGGRPPVTRPIATFADAEPEPPIFDRAAFEDTTGGLRPEDVGEHLRTLIARAEAMLPDLRAAGRLARAAPRLAEAAHLLAGGAAAFGFVSIAHSGLLFEFAADSDTPDMEALAEQLAVAIDAAVPVMRREIASLADIWNSAA